MYDLLTLAYRADITRVFTFMMAPRGQQPNLHAGRRHRRPPRRLASPEQGREARDAVRASRRIHIGLFGEFLAKLDAIPDGDGSLLDNTMLLYGSNMSNSNAHDHYPLPNVLVGGGRGRLKGGQHIVAEDHTPMTNLLLTMLDKVDVPASRRSATAPARSAS